jgi:hypothetical protein
VSGLDSNVVDPDSRDDDPHDREQSEGRTLGGGQGGATVPPFVVISSLRPSWT